ncbi:hypothetical protein [Laribacter hongkongensis]|uniref:hypothetical protein n=1 Tax=Laribacter hongkongensis TaxID=168471 RepID=UPI001EFEC12B|nr:hypothetical protein [Laribacter hongkongensis]MCG9081146.1 hypothetical protein [Laribacter hongkongensis]
MTFQEISREKFESVYYGRTPYVKLFSTEQAWFMLAIGDVTLLAVMLKCEIDKDLNVVILGRDLSKRFRAIDVISSLDSKKAVVEAMNGRIDNLIAAHVDGLFPQGDEQGVFDIFRMKVRPEKRNHYLKLLAEDPTHFPAKVMMEELAYWFKDPDGIFIRGLQGNEFNSRLFELYLHAVFYELDFIMDRDYPQPDFLLKKEGQIIAVEATTVSEIFDPADKVEFKPEIFDELQAYVDDVMPFKFARTLRKKMRHRPEPEKLAYWELPQTVGHPFVLAVHDYSRRMSMTRSRSAMRAYLYGVLYKDGAEVPIDEHVNGDDHIPSNFFGNDENRFLSAVMLPTMATIPKFNRMGMAAGLQAPNTHCVISGVRTDDDGIPNLFVARVDDPTYKEFWHEGIFMFHNPKAVNPLDPALFPHVVHIFQREDGGIEEWIPANCLLSGTTQMLRVKPEDSQPAAEE